MRLRASLGLAATSALVLAASVVAPSLVPSSTAAKPPAQLVPLAVPDPTSTTAVVTINVGGDRSSADTVAPLSGATFALFPSSPTQYDAHDGLTTQTDYVTTCTSDADGVCSFVVPIVPFGTTAPPGSVTAGTRLWAAPIAVPSGWFANPVWQTAPLSPTTQDPRVQTRHTFQTPALYAGRSYLAGRDWMVDPGIATSPAGTPASTYRQRMASDGVWPLSRVNPSLPPRCGLSVAIVADLSSSVVGYVDQLKGAITSFVDSLRGTPSRAALFTFGTRSPANGYGANSSLMSVASTADAAKFKALYANWGNPPTNYTNWDAAFNAVAAVNENPNPDEHFDLTVFITDGNPTVYGPAVNNAIPTGSGYTRFREIGDAVASANRLKSEGTRIVAVGVGSGLDQGAARNLRSVSGRDAYDGTNISEADYLQASSYAQAGNDLRNLMISQCAPSVSVIKQVIPYGGTIADAYTPTEPWSFAAATDRVGTTVTPASATTDPYTGAVNFDVSLIGVTSGTVGIAETLKPDYSLHQVDGKNAVCVNKSNDDAPVTVTDTGATSFAVDIGTQDAVSCVVYNQAPDLTVPAASVVVHKQWQVTTSAGTTTYANGTQPLDLQSTLSLTGPGDAEASGQPWDVVRGDYSRGESVTIAEATALSLPGCTLTAATIRGTGIAGNIDYSSMSTTQTVTGGTNEWTITNKVSCVSHLTLLKRVVGGDADPDSWTLSAIGPDSALPGPSGTSGASKEVTPNVPYVLAEADGADPDLLVYQQVDNRTRPLIHPASTGSMSCVLASGDSGYSDGIEGAVTVPVGQDVVCTALNETAELTIVKDVDGGSAEPSDFTFHLTPVNPDPESLPTITVAGAADPGTTVLVRPGQRYTVTETGGPEHYDFSSFACTVPPGRTPRATTDTVLLTGGTSAVCTATNVYSLWTATKTSSPASDTMIKPGTTITYTLHATHIAGGPTANVLITDDLANVLDHATFVNGSFEASEGSASLSDQTVHWTIPTLRKSETLRYQVVVDDDAYGVTLVNKLGTLTTCPLDDCGAATPPPPESSGPSESPTGEPSGPSAGPSPSEEPTGAPGPEGGDEAIDCTDPRAQAATGDTDSNCDETDHTTPDAAPPPTGPGGGLAFTGGPSFWWTVGGLALVVVGGGTAVAARRRRGRDAR